MTKMLPNKRILILCEGYTEYYYAMALKDQLPREKQRSIQVDVDVPRRNDPRNLAKEAGLLAKMARVEKNPFDAVWLFFDYDKHPGLHTAFQIIEREGFRPAFTAFCLEFWFILHFEDCRLAFDSGKETLIYLKKYWPQYHKTKIAHFNVLKEQLPVARQRAELLRKQWSEKDPIFHNNPYVTVDQLVDFFEWI